MQVLRNYLKALALIAEFAICLQGLSGGQRRRLALLCVLLEEPNVLVLDEPGNDLDTDTLAVLERYWTRGLERFLVQP